MMRAILARLSKPGFTLMELMIGAAVLALALLGLLAVFTACMSLNEIAGNITTAANGVQAEFEAIRVSSFDTVVSDYSPGGAHGNTFTVSPASWLPAVQQSGVIYLIDPPTGTPINTAGSSLSLDLYEVRIVLCWRQKGGRIIGEDTNLNGILDAGEDVNGNLVLDSPVQIVSLMARR